MTSLTHSMPGHGAIPQFENLSPFRTEPGKVPLAVSLRNATFDTMFYDTDSLSNEEKSKLLGVAFEYDEGGMLYVSAAKDNREIEYFSRSKELLEAHPELDSVVIPGVGSSMMGAAALARQIADITGRPAVGIIAGYGAADVMSEALGGFFDFGARSRALALMQQWRQQFPFLQTQETADLREKYQIRSTAYLADEPESNTLLNILLRHADKLRLLVGHSKGALNICNVLPEFVKQTELAPADYAGLMVVTLGCGVPLPEQFKNVHQYLGTWDMLGAYNTPWAIKSHPAEAHLESIDSKGHSLAASGPIHMPVADLLRRAMQ